VRHSGSENDDEGMMERGFRDIREKAVCANGQRRQVETEVQRVPSGSYTQRPSPNNRVSMPEHATSNPASATLNHNGQKRQVEAKEQRVPSGASAKRAPPNAETRASMSEQPISESALNLMLPVLHLFVNLITYLFMF
jgi:hypothetical protein